MIMCTNEVIFENLSFLSSAEFPLGKITTQSYNKLYLY